MALNFPAPTPGGTYVGPNGVTYTYDGTLGAWTASVGGGGTVVSSITVDGTNGITVNGLPAGVTITSTGTATIDFPIDALTTLP